MYLGRPMPYAVLMPYEEWESVPTNRLILSNGLTRPTVEVHRFRLQHNLKPRRTCTQSCTQ